MLADLSEWVPQGRGCSPPFGGGAGVVGPAWGCAARAHTGAKLQHSFCPGCAAARAGPTHHPGQRLLRQGAASFVSGRRTRTLKT